MKTPFRSKPIYDHVEHCYRCRLQCGKDLLIDAEDLWVLPIATWKSSKRTNHVAARGIAIHRIVMRANVGEQVDHVLGNKLDNRKSQLRICTNRQNCRSRGKNSFGQNGKCSSRFKGVSWNKTQKIWTAHIKVDGKLHHLGRFSDEAEAARAYDAAAVERHGDFARTNSALGLYSPPVKAKLLPVPEGAASIAIAGGEEIFLDQDDAWLGGIAAWGLHHQKKYVCATILIHRLIMRAPKNKWVDHENGNALDNRRKNLRLCDPIKNSRNKSRVNAASGFKGVHVDIRSDRKCVRWLAVIRVNDKLIHLGRHRTPEEAAAAYDRAAIGHFGEFAKTNKMLGLL